MKLIFPKFIFLYFCFICFTANGQTNVSKVEKTKDKRYITQVDASSIEVQKNDPSGLVKEITLGIEWWTLLNEPVEKYLFRWKRGSSVFSAAHNISLSENKLNSYPDLLKRFKELKPNYINVKIETWLNHGDALSPENQSLFMSLPSCMQKSTYAPISGKTFYELESNYGTRTINSNSHFYISKSGATGNDLSPGSPDNWAEFIKYSCTIDNELAAQLFKSSTSASFSIKLLSIQVPNNEIDAIAKEYLKRENEEVAEVKETQEHDAKIKELENQLQNLLNQGESNSNELKQINSEESSIDDFLAQKKQKQPANDFLSNKSSSSSNDFLSSNENEDDFLSTKPELKGKIENRDGKEGVVDDKGNILIPFRNWDVVEYKNGIASVSIELETFSNSKQGVGYYTASVYKYGYVDSSGEFLDGYRIKSTNYFHQTFTGLILSRGDMDGDERKRFSEKIWDEFYVERKKLRNEVEAWELRTINKYK